MLIMHEDFIKLASSDTSKTRVLVHSYAKTETSHELRDDVIPGVILNKYSLRLQPQTGT
jgi:hypothetical protein